MPKMVHWSRRGVVDVAPEKAAVYAAQGWQMAPTPKARASKPTAPIAGAAPAPEEAPTPPKKQPAKKAAQKAPAKKKS